MAASEHLNPNQLRLFMQARELMDMPTREWSRGYTTMRKDDSLYSQKLEEATSGYEHDTYSEAEKGQNNLYDSIKKEGVKSPVTLRYSSGVTNIDDGHHRIAAANAIDENMYIPVRYKN